MSDDNVRRALVGVLETVAGAQPDAMMTAAAHLGVASFVAPLIGSASSDTSTASHLLTRLTEASYRSAAEELSNALTAERISHFFAKGIALAGRVYGPGEREMADIDLYVRPADRSAVLCRVADLGYQPVPDADQDGPTALRPGVALARGGSTPGVDQVLVDVRWGIDAVTRLLPRPSDPVPPSVWSDIDAGGSLPIPGDGAHVALLIHHVVHHDLLHFRGLVDIALLWERFDDDTGSQMVKVARDLGVARVTMLLGDVLAGSLGLRRPKHLPPAPGDARARRAAALLDPVAWARLAIGAEADEAARITGRRLRRRLTLVDSRSAWLPLLADAIWPPAPWLAWRWPAKGSLVARIHHLRRAGMKLLSPKALS